MVAPIRELPHATLALVLPRTYDGQNCSIARALELVGERWTLLILRDAFLGIRRFDDFQRDLGIARNVLRDRLERLVEEGVLERRPYQERPLRHEYRLTEKGIDLWPVLVSLVHYGDRWYAPDGPPRLIVHRGCGGTGDDRRTCTRCGAPVEAREAESRPGPGARSAAAA
jgi:DNA-binding HxlR family transcriptional regulator